jgi:hypothetical protein
LAPLLSSSSFISFSTRSHVAGVTALVLALEPVAAAAVFATDCGGFNLGFSTCVCNEGVLYEAACFLRRLP